LHVDIGFYKDKKLLDLFFNIVLLLPSKSQMINAYYHTVFIFLEEFLV